MADNFVSEEFRILVLEAETIVFLIFIPFFELNDHIDGLGIFYTLDTEQGLYVNNTDPANFDEISCDIRGGTDESLIADLANLHNVITYETVSTLDELQGRPRSYRFRSRL